MEQIYNFDETEIHCAYTATKAPKLKDFYNSHIHNNYEMLFFYDGDADYVIGGSIYRLQKNDLLLIKPAVYHNLRLLSSRPYERIVFHFPEKVIWEDLLPFLRESDNFFHVDPTSPIKRLFDNIRDCYATFNDKEFDYLSQTTVNQILLNLKHRALQVEKEKLSASSTLEKILLYIDENPTLPLTINHLSEVFNLSPSWIAHSFKDKLGTSPSQYINRKKITYARSLIAMGKSPVQAADACGYVNYTTFYRQYKKYLGVSPSDEIK